MGACSGERLFRMGRQSWMGHVLALFDIPDYGETEMGVSGWLQGTGVCLSGHIRVINEKYSVQV